MVTNYRDGGGVATKRGEGQVKFYPYEKGCGKCFFAMLERGGMEKILG